MRKLHIKAQAQLDMVEIWTHIVKESQTTADAVIARLKDSINNLVLMPGMGHRRSDVRDSQIRFWNVNSFLITYRYDDSSITILRVVRGKRNMRRLHRGGELN